MASNHSFVDTTYTEVAGLVCSRLDRQECRVSLHAVSWSQHVPDVYERIHAGRLANAQEVGRDAQDLERAGSGVVGY